jgi:hypothetical protein
LLSTSCDEKLNGKFERKKRTAKVDVRLLVLLCATSGQQLQSMFVLARTHLLGMFVRSYNGFGSLVGFFFSETSLSAARASTGKQIER